MQLCGHYVMLSFIVMICLYDCLRCIVFWWFFNSFVTVRLAVRFLLFCLRRFHMFCGSFSYFFVITHHWKQFLQALLISDQTSNEISLPSHWYKAYGKTTNSQFHAQRCRNLQTIRQLTCKFSEHTTRNLSLRSVMPEFAIRSAFAWKSVVHCVSLVHFSKNCTIVCFVRFRWWFY